MDNARPGVDDVTRTLSDLLALARTMPEMIDLARAVANSAMPAATDGSGPADLARFAIRANALLLSAGVQYLNRWQELLSQFLPRIGDDLRRMESDGRVTAAARDRLVTDILRGLRDMAQLPSEYGRDLGRQLDRLEADMAGPGVDPAPRRRWKAKE